MALYNMNPKPTIKEGTSDEYMRTQTNLIKDEGDAPSGRKAVDPRLERKFLFHFGGQNGWVVIPKGRIVSIDPDFERKSFDDGMYYNVFTLANGGTKVTEVNPDGDNYTRAPNRPCGVSTLNIYEDIDDSFRGNIPVFYTRNTINLPYFALKADAEKTEWGSVYGSLNPGDKVMSDESGRLVKWEEHKTRSQTFTGDGTETEFVVDYAIWPEEDVEITVAGTGNEDNSIAYASGTISFDSEPENEAEIVVNYKSVVGDDITQIVGQVVNLNAHVNDGMVNYAGWLKWVMPEGNYIDETGYRPEDLTASGHLYDSQYLEGFDDKTMAPTGIPGLTDGANITVPYSDKPLGTIPENMGEGEVFSFHVLPAETPIVEDTLVVKFENEDVTDDVVDHVDYKTGLIILKLDADNITGAEATIDVTADFSATHQLAGLPSQYDFSGVYGDADVLLQL